MNVPLIRIFYFAINSAIYIKSFSASYICSHLHNYSVFIVI